MSRNILDKDKQLEADVSRLHRLVMTLGRRKSLRDPISNICEDRQFTPSQVHTLIWLGEDGPLTMSDLSRRLGITEKTMTGLIDRLERENHVRRERDESDRRLVRVRLTEQGQGFHADMRGHMDGKLADMLSLLDIADRQTLFGLLEKLISRSGERAQEFEPSDEDQR